MDLEPGYAELRAAHGSDLAVARQKLFMFLCGRLGGPSYYTDQFGHSRLRARHMPFSIGIKERDQWVACMDQAMGETGVPQDLRARLKESFMGTADWMRNKGVGGCRTCLLLLLKLLAIANQSLESVFVHILRAPCCGGCASCTAACNGRFSQAIFGR
jgi:hemoglobin